MKIGLFHCGESLILHLIQWLLMAVVVWVFMALNSQSNHLGLCARSNVALWP